MKTVREQRWIAVLGIFLLIGIAEGRAASYLNGQRTSPPSSASEERNAAPTDVAKLYQRGEAALRKGELGDAEAAFRKVLAADPRSAGAYTNLGVIAMRRKDWGAALALLQKAEKLAPKVGGIRLNIGLVRYQRGEHGAAIAPLQSDLRDDPKS